MNCYQLAILLVVTTVSPDTRVQIYRFGKRDLFTNPNYTASCSSCMVQDTCKIYKAKCIEDDKCKLCMCTSKFSTYNRTLGRCVSDEEIWSESGSMFRFIQSGQPIPRIPLYRLTKTKELGQIGKISNITTLRDCSVVYNASEYWSEGQQGNWKPLELLSNDRLFELSYYNDVNITLKWTPTDPMTVSKFQGLVIRLSIQCAAINQSNIVFKTWKNYNGEKFMGCLKAKTKAPIKIQQKCSSMTPRLCKKFCRSMGRSSVALLRKGSECSCVEKTQVKAWKKIKLSACVTLCSGNPLKFCGGNETYSAYRLMPGRLNPKEINDSPFCPNQTVLLPSTNISPSAAYKSSASHLHYSTLVNGVFNGRQKSRDKDLLPFYIVVPLACIVCGFFIGVLTIMHCKRYTSMRNLSRQTVEIVDFINTACSADQEPERSIEPQMYPRRKSRTDRLPSLPKVTRSEQPVPVNASPNTSEIPSTVSLASEEASQADNDISNSENNIYETPTICNSCGLPNGAHSNLQLDEKDDLEVGESVETLPNPTYESINSYMDPNSLYLEVLP